MLISYFLFLGSLLFSGQADSEKLKEEMERAKYDAEMKAVAEEEATKSQQQMSQDCILVYLLNLKVLPLKLNCISQ